jgi:hypothetical protein
VTVADELIGHLPGKLPQAGADVMMPRVVDGLEALGILPPDGDTVRERAHDVMETRMVGAATVLVAALTIQLTARGALPTGRCHGSTSPASPVTTLLSQPVTDCSPLSKESTPTPRPVTTCAPD